MNLAKLLPITLKAFVWIPIVVFSSLLIHNSLLYFTFDTEYGILPEKSMLLKNNLWTTCFYLHVFFGIFCLSLPWISFLGNKFSITRKIHSVVGLLYVSLTLLIVAPTGMFLAIYAKGGLPSQTGFLVQGILISYFTYQGYLSAQRFKILAHVQWMIRSYAMATAVLTFRVYHVIFYFTNVPYSDMYGISQWLSILSNALLAEAIILLLVSSTTYSNPKKIQL